MRERFLIGFAVAALAVGLVGIFSHYHAPGSTYTLALSAFATYLGIGAVLAAVLFALLRTRLGWAGCAVAIGVVVWTVALQVPAYVAQTLPTQGTDVVVMTSNLKVGAADPHAVVAAARSHHVDVLMLEELTPGIRRALRGAGLDEFLPHSVADPHDGGAGTGLWSRYPLTDASVRRDLGFSFVTARTKLPGGETTLAAIHVFGPYPQAQFPRWNSDMHAYPGVLSALPGQTVLIGGDFNATGDDVQFRTVLGDRYLDAAVQAGAGYTPTWPANRWYPPLITIDHVLTQGAVARSADTVEIAGSDHRALIVSVRIPG
ncbi:MAG TPA: endonuclease/exonuclease/phosphatase family protein [Jatrophihabitans sp.]|jgi:endonuclease/exonuclease/phosphatase (EEP) superfamily protein YafD